MAVAKPIVGINAIFTLTPVGGGTTITLKNSDWEITPDPNVAEAPNTTDGMLRTIGLFDYKGKVTGNTDATSTATSPEAQAQPGAVYTFQAYRSSTTSVFYSGTLIIGPLAIKTGTGTVENWSFDFMKQSGVLTYPNGSTQ